MNLEKLVERAVQSTLFTAPVLGPHLEKFLAEQGEKVRGLAREAVQAQVGHFYWIGCGNSLVNLWSGKYLLDRFSDTPSDCATAYEFLWGAPKRLGPKSWVFLASWSGSTEDTVAALRYARSQGARTVALVNKADCLMGREADWLLAYESKALYILPLAAVYLFALEYARLRGAGGLDPVVEGLHRLPELLERQYVEEKQPAGELAEKFRKEKIFYTLGSGVLWGLAYKFGLTVFMENMRVHGSFIDAAEFRHGPVEMLDRGRPAFVVLKAADECRTLVERVTGLLESRKVPLLVYDAARYEGVHPLLAPFVLMIPLQWFAVYSAFLRGITDLDERALMGHGILSQGKGVTWP
jgi:fructoselysine-6-P-deglycase FrlB-like protein